MKKLIAILTIAIVLVGSVFAGLNDVDTTRTITVTTTVARKKPDFKLTGSQDSSAIATGTAVTDETADELAAAEDISIDDIQVFFGVYQVGLANVRKSYNLSVSAGNLILWDDTGNNATHEAAKYGAGSYATVPEGKVSGNYVFEIAPTNASPAISAATIADTVKGHDKIDLFEASAEGASNSKFTVAYKGKVGETTGDILLGTFDVTWNHNTEAEAGNYKANVVLTVETV